jgi:hypothetical protein
MPTLVYCLLKFEQQPAKKGGNIMVKFEDYANKYQLTRRGPGAEVQQ